MTLCAIDRTETATWEAPVVQGDGTYTVVLVCDSHFEGWFDDVPYDDYQRMRNMVRHIDPNCLLCKIGIPLVFHQAWADAGTPNPAPGIVSDEPRHRHTCDVCAVELPDGETCDCQAPIRIITIEFEIKALTADDLPSPDTLRQGIYDGLPDEWYSDAGDGFWIASTGFPNNTPSFHDIGVPDNPDQGADPKDGS